MSARVVLLAALAASFGAAAEARQDPPPSAQVLVGQLLFWDKVLSGNRDISCGTCHHPDYGTSDGVALGLGTGASGVGPGRQGPGERMRRNAPALFNLHDMPALFLDGRVQAVEGGVASPLGEALPPGLDGLLAAQALFPMLSPAEMAGPPGSNPVADAVAAGQEGQALDLIAARVAGLPGYEQPFRAVIGDRPPDSVDIANAIAAFVAFEWRSEDSPYDVGSLSEAAQRGRTLFEGPAGCAACHAGPLQTDGGFHVTAAPGADRGRQDVTGDPADAFAFRTASLRNVALTGPYGPDGATSSLPAYLARHPLGRAWKDPRGREDLYQFLLSLTGEGALAGRLGVPAVVPSGLAVDR